MAENTRIEWADRTWSPWIGCQKVSPACDGCYAEHLMDTRMGRVEWGPHGERKRTSAPYWRQPLAWNRAAAAAGRVERVFPSLCDPFDNRVDPAWRRDFFDLIRATPHLQWLLLTKRPQNIVEMCEAAGGLPANAAIGTTCEDQPRANLNVRPLLDAARDLRPAFTFVSAEPLLGPIDFTRIVYGTVDGYRIERDALEASDIERIDWVITGGETDQGKHKARPSHPDWFRQIRDQCARAEIPYLHKQNGEWVDADSIPSEALEDYDARGLTADGVARVGKKRAGRLLDGVEHNGFPASGRVGAEASR